MRLNFPLTIFLCWLSNICTAQLEPIETDRPDQTESVSIVPKGWLQFEAGIGVTQTDGEGNNEFLIPTLLSKYGISNKIELRLITSYLRKEEKLIGGNGNSSGLEPIEVGAKVALCEEKKLRPQTSFIFHFAIPHTAATAYDIKNVAPNFRFSMQNSVTDKLAIGYNIGAEWDGEGGKPAYIYTFSPGLNFGKQWYGYIEAFGKLAEEANEHSIDGGFAYNVTNNIKLDLSSGFGLSEAAPNFYIALGFSARFNTKKRK